MYPGRSPALAAESTNEDQDEKQEFQQQQQGQGNGKNRVEPISSFTPNLTELGAHPNTKRPLTEMIERSSDESTHWADTKAFWREFKRDVPGVELGSDADSDTDFERLASDDDDDLDAEVSDGGSETDWSESDTFFENSNATERLEFDDPTDMGHNDEGPRRRRIAAGTPDGSAQTGDPTPHLSRFRRIRQEYRRVVRARDRTMLRDYATAAVHISFYGVSSLVFIHFMGYWKPLVQLARIEFRLIFVLVLFALALFGFEFYLACKPIFYRQRPRGRRGGLSRLSTGNAAHGDITLPSAAVSPAAGTVVDEHGFSREKERRELQSVAEVAAKAGSGGSDWRSLWGGSPIRLQSSAKVDILDDGSSPTTTNQGTLASESNGSVGSVGSRGRDGGKKKIPSSRGKMEHTTKDKRIVGGSGATKREIDRSQIGRERRRERARLKSKGRRPKPPG